MSSHGGPVWAAADISRPGRQHKKGMSAVQSSLSALATLAVLGSLLRTHGRLHRQSLGGAEGIPSLMSVTRVAFIS